MTSSCARIRTVTTPVTNTNKNGAGVLGPAPALVPVSPRMLRLLAARRRYSSAPPLAEIHQQLADVESLFQRYKLHQINDPAALRALVAQKAVPEPMGAMLLADLEHRLDAEKTANMWRKIFWYVGVPAMGLLGLNTYYLEKEHFHHLHEHPVDHIAYPHMRIRNKVRPVVAF